MMFYYTRIIEYLCCHQSGFTHQLVEKDAETHSQTLGRAQRILWKEGLWEQRGQKHHKKTHKINLPGLMGFTEY